MIGHVSLREEQPVLETAVVIDEVLKMHVKTFPEVDADPGIKRQVLSETPDLMVVTFRFQEAGVEGKLHSHPHTQSTYVESGKFRFSINGEEFEVGRGDSFIIPSEARHGCVCLEPGTLIDTFSPRRDDFL